MHTDTQREAELFDEARRLGDPAARHSYLDGVCAGDAALRTRLETLLAAEQEAENFFAESGSALNLAAVQLPLSRGSAGLPGPAGASVPGEEPIGTRIGRYKLVQKIGEGGWGVVYMAEQEEPVRRRVALKIIKLGMETKSVIARFEAERQALAMMDHPNIAHVYDAGATDRGPPYFVMELVRGVRITQYCDQHRLGTAERLDLFIQVCHAIQHAHQKGIIHGDIKPSNIMVTLHDGIPVPKVIDFGIAKATEARLTDRLLFSSYAQLIGTPAYMSPEQADMSGVDTDTRSDIYSLGVLLYELLAGSTPFDAKELMASGIDAMRKTIREKEPIRPSTKLSQTLVAAGTRRLKISFVRNAGLRGGSRSLTPAVAN
jgi:eukaryotic-like serine/threonine-protein kinase